MFTQLKLQDYTIKNLNKDILSGIVVGIIALPLGMAFAIASGVKPEYGIYTTIVAGILISMFGGSKFQIGGPTGAFIPIVFGIVASYGYENLLIAGFLAGCMLLLMGLLRLGSVIKFMPRPVTIGFTAGIAVIIFSGQIATLLGLTGIEKHEEFIANMREIILHIASFNSYAIITAIICFVIILATPKLFPRVPGPLIGLIVSGIFANIIFYDKIDTIASIYGVIPSSLPSINLPVVNLAKIQQLLRPAFIIAMLGSIESLLSAVVADGMTGTKHDSNRELIGQGIANMITPLFGGIPATGAIARTATNIKNGATSPISGIVHGIFVLLTLLLFAPFASQIPLASMSVILMLVAWNMSGRKEFVHILKTKTGDSLVMLITFFLTVFFNLTVAIEIGLILAIVLFTKHMSSLMVINKVLPDPNQGQKVVPYVVSDTHDCPQISIFTVEGSLFFGAAEAFANTILDTINLKPKILILRMSKVIYMDTTGEASLSNIINGIRKNGGTVIISGICQQPKEVLMKTGLYQQIGPDNFFNYVGEAIDYSLKKISCENCVNCKHLAFKECSSLKLSAEPATA